MLRMTMQKVIFFWAALCTVLLIALGGLSLAYASVLSDHQTRSQAQGGCTFARVIADLHLPAQPAAPLLQIVAAARVWYSTAHCPGERLAPPDPRVRVYLPNVPR